MLLLLLTLLQPAQAQAAPSCTGAEACVRAGLSYTTGRGDIEGLRKAAAAFDRACAEGDTQGACGHAQLLRLAWPELGAGSAADPSSLSAASAELAKVCDNNAACTSLGVAYEQGLGVSADSSKALELHRKACAAGVVRSCTRQAELHASGPVGYRDPAQASSLRQQACTAGDPLACEAMASTVLSAGAPSAGDKAAPLLAKACEGGSPAACTRLARLHLEGELSEPSPEQAQALLERACAAGHAEACSLKR
ncbi:MAG: sel1 repeat family protein [Alphaproteobacteria bacterium]|nr:sel1 repeat family protein [Alphaproteobacteria bacterium]MCB9794406.1 sel1 repeat family protein [Alphaproteobacteria bacterium]